MRHPTAGAARTLLALSVLAWLAPAELGAQYEPRFRRWTAADGLSQASALALFQDGRGFLWVGTQDGLNRLDGSRFTAFRTDLDDPTTLRDDHVRAVVEDAAGVLWVATLGGGLHRLADDGAATPVALGEDAGGEGGDPQAVLDLVVESDSTLLAATGVGLRRIRTADAAVTTPPFARIDSLESLAVIDGELWLGGATGIVHRGTRRGGEWALEEVARTGAMVRQLARGPDGGVIVATQGGGVRLLDGAGPRGSWSSRAGTWEDERFDDVLAMLVDGEGALWLGTRGGLLRGDGGGPPFHPITAVDGDVRSLPHDQVHALLEDRTGVLWVGTWNGLGSLGPQRSAIRAITAARAGRSGLDTPDAVGLHEDARGRVWIGTLGGDLSVWDREAETLDLVVDGDRSGAPWGSDIFALEGRSPGGLWVATMGGGLLAVAEAGRVEGRFLEEGRETRFVTSVVEDRRGDVWAGTVYGGLQRRRSGEFEFAPYAPTGPLAGSYVWPIVESRGGELWVGVFEGGVHRLDADREVVAAYVHDAEDPASLSSDRVLTLHEGPDGSIWVGTQGGGLNRLDPGSGRVERFGPADGLPSDHVQGLRTDPEGRLWASTSEGLARFDPGEGRFQVFAEPAGLEHARFYANAALRARDGTLVFGGQGGLTVVDAGRLRTAPGAPPVVLTGFVLGGEGQPPGAWARGLEPLVLAPDESFFAFEFAALEYVDPELNRYRYRLRGLDPEWNESRGRGFANYTKVRHGRYTFEVEAAGAAGDWSEGGLAIPVQVLPPFYHTWWFRALVAVAVAGGLGAAHRARLRTIERERVLEEEQRAKFATELHNRIGGHLSTIKLRAGLTDALPPEAEGWARKIEDVTEQAITAVRDMQWVVDHGYDNAAALVVHLRTIADRMLGDFVAYTFEVEGEASPDVPAPAALREDLRSGFMEMLQNVQKHAGASSVRIGVTFEAPWLTLVVEDDGRGITAGRTPTGTGLRRLEELARRHQGDAAVEALDRGTSARLRVRLPERPPGRPARS